MSKPVLVKTPQAVHDFMSLSGELDKLKASLHKINRTGAITILNRENPPLFVLYYAVLALFEGEIDIELEAVDLLPILDKNKERFKAMYSVMYQSSFWREPIAFSVGVSAVNNMEIKAGVITPFNQEELVKGIFIALSIEGGTNLPFSANVWGYIVACFKNEGIAVPPLCLLTNTMAEYYREDKEYLNRVVRSLGSYSLSNMVMMSEASSNFIDLKNVLELNILASKALAHEVSETYKAWPILYIK